MNASFEHLLLRAEQLITRIELVLPQAPSQPDWNASTAFRYRKRSSGRATLEPVRGKLSQRFMGEKLGGDNTWRDHMRNEILRTEVEIYTVLGEREMRLADVHSLEIGQTIPFDVTPDDPFEVCCGGVPLARAQIGRQRNHVAIGIVDTIKQGQSQ